MITVADLPSDPARYLRSIDSDAYFETASFSQEDSARNEMYVKNFERKKSRKKFTDLSGFLEDLEMKVILGDFDDNNISRNLVVCSFPMSLICARCD